MAHFRAEFSVVEPDILFIRSENLSIIQKNGIYGVPDFIIEILSGNIIHDKKRKLKLYEENRVPEYIIIDPESKEVWHYVLCDETYHQLLNEQPGRFYIQQLSTWVAV